MLEALWDDECEKTNRMPEMTVSDLLGYLVGLFPEIVLTPSLESMLVQLFCPLESRAWKCVPMKVSPFADHLPNLTLQGACAKLAVRIGVDSKMLWFRSSLLIMFYKKVKDISE
ncbi:hypothetical protein KIN20_029434 [Parelaphostrongylus tenuis]|uniref:Uncharacterized protein n=1 Tax=Parelaphostrongylus tenuis TaxID=148309 RepID=A0AAD5R2D9_PARTN|nr:hypothetical protein KIN20_029434 [Parelaphostrongylus tenuis]